MENKVKSPLKPTLENDSASGNQVGQLSLQSVLLYELKLESINVIRANITFLAKH